MELLVLYYLKQLEHQMNLDAEVIINSEGFVLNIQFLECYRIVEFRLCENVEEQPIYIIGVESTIVEFAEI